MGRHGRVLWWVVLPVVAAAGVVLLVACGEPPPEKWQQVTSGRFDPSAPGPVDLGSFHVSGDVRLAWDLTGPADARALFKLEAAHVTGSGGTEAQGTSARSWSSSFSRRNDSALILVGLKPGDYHITVVQRFDKRHGTGFGGEYTVFATADQ